MIMTIDKIMKVNTKYIRDNQGKITVYATKNGKDKSINIDGINEVCLNNNRISIYGMHGNKEYHRKSSIYCSVCDYLGYGHSSEE